MALILIQKIVLQRLNQITANDLLRYAKQYGVSLTQNQAADVAKLMNGKHVNIFIDAERNRLIKQVEAITSKQTAKTVNDLFNQFTS